MKKMTKKKKGILISSVSGLLAAATVAGVLTMGAQALTYHSFEYIEKLKSQYAGGTMQIMEIAPSESQGVFGYLVEGSEPVKDWKAVTSMYNNKTSRENYAENLFENLKREGLLSAETDGAPLLLLDDYKECYPWDAADNSDLTNILELQYPETAYVTGKMTKVEDGTGAYDANFSYSLEGESFLGKYDFGKFREKTINIIGLKPLDAALGIKNKTTKVMAVDVTNKSVSVFGSTEANWESNSGYPYYYDLTSAYKSKDYYSVEDLEPGKTYCVSFEASVVGGKGQFTLLPYDSNNKLVYFSPNYSNQYWLWSEYFESTADGTPLIYQFTIPEGSPIRKVQLRFDVSSVETSAKLRKVNVYEFNEEHFATGEYKAPGVTVNSSAATVSVAADKSNANFNEFPASGASSQYKYYPCEPNQIYTLAYHVESSGGMNGAQIYEFDSSHNLIKKFVADADVFKSGSGTRAETFMTDPNAAYIGIVFASKSATGNKKVNQVYSHISLTAYRDYVAAGSATHVQVYDHFSTGLPQPSLGVENLFNYDKWFVSGSNRIKDTTQPGNVEAYDNGIISIQTSSYKDQTTNYSTGNFLASEMLYYIPVESSSSYRLSFRPIFDEGKSVTYSIIYANSEKNYIGKQSFTVSSADLDDTGLYSKVFTPPAGTSYIQLCFGVSEADQKASFDFISLYEQAVRKSYFYNLVFDEVNISDLDGDNEEDIGTPLYTVTDFVEAGLAETVEIDPVKAYYYLDQYSNQYVRVTGTPAAGTMLYLPGPYYIWAGNFGTEGFYANEDTTYYTARINDQGYVRAAENNISRNAVLYTKSGNDYNVFGLYTPETDLVNNEYYILSAPVSDSFDSIHPYYLEANEFRLAEEGEKAYFIAELNDYKYVGVGGGYNFENGDEDLVIQTSTIFYKGDFKNNNWFKRFVLDCKGDNEEDLQAALDAFNVNVVTFNPNKLNLLEHNDTAQVTELSLALSDFELCVFTSGLDLSKGGAASYESDITPVVEKYLESRLLVQDDTDTEFMPIAIDTSLLNVNKPQLKKLAQAVCTEKDQDGRKTVKDTSGIYDYIYRFKGGELASSAKLIVNDFFIRDIDSENRSYEKQDDKYNIVWQAIQYENALRDAREKYFKLDELVSEAGFIRHIMNYKGQRSVNNKAVIRILEIEPMSCDSVLYAKNKDKGGKKVIDVRRWFTDNTTVFDAATNDDDKDIHYTYVDDRGIEQVGTSRFEIVTMAPHELSGKIEDLAEVYDLVYVGTSLDGFNKLAYEVTDAGGNTHLRSLTNKSMEKEVDHTSEDDFVNINNLGKIFKKNDKIITTVPDYNEYEAKPSMDGFYYTSTGEIFQTEGDGLLDRSNVGGLIRNDYIVLGINADSKPQNALWYVHGQLLDEMFRSNGFIDRLLETFGLDLISEDASATFRDSGNDITDTKMQELQMFIDQGLPVVVGDNLCLQDYTGELKVKIMGKTYYQRKGRTVYLPGYENNANYSFEAKDNKVHVVLTAKVVGELPKGTITSFQWYYVDKNGNNVAINQSDTEELLFPRIRELLGLPSTQQVTNKDYVSIDSDGDGVKDLFCLDFVPTKYINDGDYFCTVNYDFSNCTTALGDTLRYNGLYGNTAKVNVASNKIHVAPENRTYTIEYFDYSDNPAYRELLMDHANSVHYKADKTFVTSSDMCMFAAITPIPADANDYVAYRATIRNTDTTGSSAYDWSELVTDWERSGGSAAWVQGENAPYHYRANPGNRRQIDVYMRITHVTARDGKKYELCSYIDSGENGGEKMKNKGFSFYFNVPSDDVTDSDYRISAGGYGRFKDKYTDADERTMTISGYKLYLKDANGNRVTSAAGYADSNGGYTLTGVDTNGSDICGQPAKLNTRADIMPERIDNCSNMYDVLSTSIRSLKNVMTQNQVERKDNSYRELLKQYVNLSEPKIEFVGGAPVSYPEEISASTRALSFSFKVTNETDVDTVNARYNCELFVDDNGDGQFVPSEIVDATITGGGNNGVGGLKTTSKASGEYIYKLSYKFGKNESGIKPWRLKITKIGEEGAHTSYTDYAFIKSTEPRKLKALQILAGDWDPGYVASNPFPSGYDKLPGEKDNPYHGNLYKGSVFLSDIYVDDELLNINQGITVDGKNYDIGTKMTRTIWYNDGGAIVPGEVNEKYVYNRNDTRTIDHVEFDVAQDYQVDIYFTNVETINKDIEDDPEMLEDYNILVLGYGDLYGKMGLGKTKSSIDIAETIGFNQGAAIAIEEMINSGQRVLFCHDTITSNVNFVNYWANDALAFGNDAANAVANFWNKFKSVVNAIGDMVVNLFKTGKLEFVVDKSDWNEYNSEIHTSRIKQGYYTNLVMRDPLNQDRYGVSRRIKERADKTYDDDHLKIAHNFNNIYDDDKKGSNSPIVETLGDFYYKKDGSWVKTESYNEWKHIYRSLASDAERTEFEDYNRNKGGKSRVSINVLMMEEYGYSIAWVPGTDKTQVDVFAQGFTSYSVHRFAEGDSGTTDTNRVSQVNEGQITSYPYYINVEDMYARDESGKQEILKTHEQYFQVNINENQDGEVATVWYCLAPGSGAAYSSSYNEFRNDCENAYYVYTKGNVTYTGAGHTNGFTAFEAKLFFNAIVASDSADQKRPSISFHASPNDAAILKYKAFVKTADTGAETTDGYYMNDGEVIWREPVYFKVNNATASLVRKENREVKFFMDDPANAGEKIDITSAVAIKDTDGNSVASDMIVPGLFYEIQVPDTVFDSMMTNELVNTKIYVEVVLSSDEEMAEPEESEIIIDDSYGEETTVLTRQSETADLEINLTGLFNLR